MTLPGVCNFELEYEIKQIHKLYGKKELDFVLDFDQVTRIDSSFLGFIFLFRREVGLGKRFNVSLINVPDKIYNMLTNFETLYEIERKK